MSFSIVEQILGSALVTGGTITVTYPSGKNKGSFYGAVGHSIVTDPGNDVYNLNDGDFTISLGDSSATITWKSTTTIPAGTRIKTQLNEPGQRTYVDAESRNLLLSTTTLKTVLVNLGNPLTADDDALVASATSTELPNATTITYDFPDDAAVSPLDGANQTGVLDVPRNVTIAVTHGSSIVATTVTVTGTDAYGETLVEALSVTATGTSKTAAGKKAFKTVTSIAITSAGDSTTNTVKVGFGDVLGLPIFLPHAGYVIKELEDGAAPTAGTFVAGVLTSPATSTTGDVRGTYDPNSACNGSKVFQLLVAAPDLGFLGLEQYAG